MKKLLVFLLFTSYTLSSQIYKEQDKQLHFAAGNIAGATGYIWSYQKHQDKKRAIITGVCTAFASGVLKEMYDASQGGYVEHDDILATTLGGITISLTVPLFQRRKLKHYRQLDTIQGGYLYPRKRN